MRHICPTWNAFGFYVWCCMSGSGYPVDDRFKEIMQQAIDEGYITMTNPLEIDLKQDLTLKEVAKLRGIDDEIHNTDKR